MRVLKRGITLLCGCTLLLGAGAIPAWGDTVVVVSKRSTITRLSETEAKAIFLGKMTRLPGGSEIQVLLQDSGTAAHAEFLEKLVARTDAQFKSLWARRVFTGAVSPPLQLPDNRAVVDHVARLPGSIGYISTDTVNDSVRVVYTVKK